MTPHVDIILTFWIYANSGTCNPKRRSYPWFRYINSGWPKIKSVPWIKIPLLFPPHLSPFPVRACPTKTKTYLLVAQKPRPIANAIINNTITRLQLIILKLQKDAYYSRSWTPRAGSPSASISRALPFSPLSPPPSMPHRMIFCKNFHKPRRNLPSPFPDLCFFRSGKQAPRFCHICPCQSPGILLSFQPPRLQEPFSPPGHTPVSFLRTAKICFGKG